ncbi:MAG: hypothetical protein ACI4TD_00170 [Phocaeicola sp.]
MGIKRFFICAALPFMMLSTTLAQETSTDSLKALSEEFAQIKSKITQDEIQLKNKKIWKRRKYWKFGYSIPKIERTDGMPMEWKTDFSVSLQRGKTAYLHSKPIAGMIKFGIDYGFFDISYSKLKLNSFNYEDGDDSSTGPSVQQPTTNPGGFDNIVGDDPDTSIGSALGIDLGMHKFEYGLHVGPSVNVNPWNHIIVSAYFHVMPTASGIVQNDSFSYGFGCNMSAGVSVSYKLISVGVEGLWSKIKYKQASFDGGDEGDYSSVSDVFNTETFKLKQKGPRFYVAFRF